jgi:endonuclease YncB( thermonuclease family)
MNLKFILVSLILISSNAFAANCETVQVGQALKGDTVIVGRRGKLGSDGGTGLYVHIAGVDAPELNQPGGRNSLAYLSRITTNQKACMLIYKQVGNQAIATLYLGDGGYGKDIGSLLVQNGQAFYRSSDEAGLNAVQQSSYKTLSEHAKYAKIGLWANGNMNYTITPDSFRSLQTWQYQQQYINGATPPQQNDFGRNTASQGGVSTPQAPQNQNVQLNQRHGGTGSDWRNYKTGN